MTYRDTEMAGMSTGLKQPVRVFASDKDFQVPDLERILCSNDVKDLKVVVISVAGRARRGKSFLLNFILRFLRTGGKLEQTLGVHNELSGFEWKNTRHSVTQGVLVWPEVFKLDRPNGETVAVVLIDTQGVFDTSTTIQESTSIFSYSMFLSSIQIFNLKDQINEDDLGQLEMFSQHGKYLLENKSESEAQSEVFQDLVLLIRDWSYASDIPYGWEGGQRALEEELNKTMRDDELQSKRTNIKSTFKSRRCFLMPHPGDIVNSSGEFRGSLKGIDEDFLNNMGIFLQGLLSPGSLVPKIIDGRSVTLQEWCSSLLEYSERFKSPNAPAPKTTFEATVHASSTTALKDCTKFYQEEMLRELGQSFYEVDVLFKKHREIADRSLAAFTSSLKMGDEAFRLRLELELRGGLDSLFGEQFITMNQCRSEAQLCEVELKAREEETRRLSEELKYREHSEAMEAKLATLEAEKVSLAKNRDRLIQEIDARVRALEEGRRSWLSKIATNIIKIF